jgi:ubiquinol-cytochrome c reductase cytochrome b subunit
MAEAFMGYLLPWGNMSFWARRSSSTCSAAIPVIGPGLVEWIRGDYGIADATLNRFFSLHVVAVPLVLLGCWSPRIWSRCTRSGRTTPTASRSRSNKDAKGNPLDGIPFHPYYTVKDVVRRRRVPDAVLRSSCSSCPTFGGYLPREAELRSRPTRCRRPSTSRRCGTSRRSTPSCGAGARPAARVRWPWRCRWSAWRLLPWLDRSPVTLHALSRLDAEDRADAVRHRLRGAGRDLGLEPPSPAPYTTLARIRSVVYFAFFALMPAWTPVRTRSSRCRPVRPYDHE